MVGQNTRTKAWFNSERQRNGWSKYQEKSLILFRATEERWIEKTQEKAFPKMSAVSIPGVIAVFRLIFFQRSVIRYVIWLINSCYKIARGGKSKMRVRFPSLWPWCEMPWFLLLMNDQEIAVILTFVAYSASGWLIEPRLTDWYHVQTTILARCQCDFPPWPPIPILTVWACSMSWCVQIDLWYNLRKIV
jgi:hypothetical protein